MQQWDFHKMISKLVQIKIGIEYDITFIGRLDLHY